MVGKVGWEGVVGLLLPPPQAARAASARSAAIKASHLVRPELHFGGSAIANMLAFS
jgi:hypothetical protein